jgi:hypothetical protein
VLVSGLSPAIAVAASSLAGATDAPLLLTSPRKLSDAPRREINRLNARRVYLVGDLGKRVARGVRRTGADVTRVGGSRRYVTAMAVARLAVKRGANPRTVIVASGRRWNENLGVSALAAGKQYPVLLAPRSGGRAALAKRVRELGARRVFVVGRFSTISKRVVKGLPNKTRLAAPGAVGTVAETAARGRAMGLDHRPVLVGAHSWADAAAWGPMAGQHGSVVVASKGRGLSGAVQEWLDRFDPRRATVVQAQSSIGALAKCQVSTGRQRSWFCAEQTLQRQGYHMPQVDGRADRFSVWAIFAFEKVAGLGAHGSFGNTEWNRMVHNPRMKVRRPDLPKKHVEINIKKQLVLLVRKGKVRHVVHTSTGKPSTPLVRGTFTVYEKRPYMQSNHMYKSIFFYGGYAIHGYKSIPTYPASHGCARTYNGNQDFIYPKIDMGERVATY